MIDRSPTSARRVIWLLNSPLTKWKLALLYEAMGDIDQARENFTEYQQLNSEQTAKDEAALHLSTLEAKRAKYDEEIDEAEEHCRRFVQPVHETGFQRVREPQRVTG